MANPNNNAAANLVKTVKDVSIAREGTKLVIPEDVPLQVAIEAIMLKQAEENEEVAIDQKFEMTVPEGAFALLKALREIFGFVSPKATPTMFGKKPPTFLGLEVGAGVVEMVPWGRLAMPGVDGYLQTAVWGEESPKFCLQGVVKGRDKAMVDKIATYMRETIARESIYRGKAIRCSFPDPKETQTIEAFFPKFMTLDGVKEDNLILSEETHALLRTALFVPIEKTARCREENIPLKRGILLEGPFGVGKTLASLVTAQKAIANGWTFIHLDNVDNLKQALDFARQYQPAVIFAEDIDQILGDPDERTERVNDILNQIDGIESKGTEVITVLTTNNLENITTAMLRPGRLDAVVPVRAPDARAAERLVRLYAGQLMNPHEDLTSVGQKLAGHIPAVIREVVERSKLGAIWRDSRSIIAGDVETAADGMKAHNDLLSPKPADERSPVEKAADKIVAGALKFVDLANRGAANGQASIGGAANHALPSFTTPGQG